ARYVIHAVGPVYHESTRPAEQLAAAVQSALRRADEYDLRSIALPAISTGIFGYPVEEAAEVMLRAAIAYLQAGQTRLERVIFCLYGQSAYQVFETALSALLPTAQ
ncbi:MAG: macro domain-containing protein, partial [Anaerolineae bacterium]|nr:macro domain-containing protein [Anaerolineae bacterium]